MTTQLATLCALAKRTITARIHTPAAGPSVFVRAPTVQVRRAARMRWFGVPTSEILQLYPALSRLDVLIGRLATALNGSDLLDHPEQFERPENGELVRLLFELETLVNERAS